MAHKYLQDMDQAMQNARKCMQAAQQRQKRYAGELTRHSRWMMMC